MTRPPATTVLPSRRSPADAEILRLRDELRAALGGWRQAKRRFEDVTDAYLRRSPRDPVTAEIRAGSDPRRIRAGADCSWFQSEVQTAALAILALDRASTRDGDR